MTDSVPAALAQVLRANQSPSLIFSKLLPILGQVLGCDDLRSVGEHRCFLYLRHPQTSQGKIAYCWCRRPAYPDLTNTDWQLEPDSLALAAPLFAAVKQV